MPLSDEQIYVIAGPADYWDRRVFARAIEEASTAPLLAQIAEWEKLKSPDVLHANLLRGLPAPLTPEQFLHISGYQDRFAQLEAQLAEAKKDAERFIHIATHLECDGFGVWLPEICIAERDELLATVDEVRAAIDAAIAQEQPNTEGQRAGTGPIGPQS